MGHRLKSLTTCAYWVVRCVMMAEDFAIRAICISSRINVLSFIFSIKITGMLDHIDFIPRELKWILCHLEGKLLNQFLPGRICLYRATPISPPSLCHFPSQALHLTERESCQPKVYEAFLLSFLPSVKVWKRLINGKKAVAYGKCNLAMKACFEVHYMVSE